jgi:hypothetical protein
MRKIAKLFIEDSLPISNNTEVPESINRCDYRHQDRFCGLIIRVPGFRTEMYCDYCEVWTEFMYVMWKKEDRLCGLLVRVPV